MKKSPLIRFLLTGAVSLLLLASCQKTVPVHEHVPVVYADSSRTITLPLDSVILHGSASDTGGKVVAWLWSEVSGPNVPLIRTEGSPSTVISGFVQGVYVFQLMVVDSAGETGVNTVKITVNAGPIKVPPKTVLLNTGSPAYEIHLMGNSVHDASVAPAPEMNAGAWTVFGEYFALRAMFRFDMSAIPAGTVVKSAQLSLFSNRNPINGDHIHANSGSNNAFYIQRVATSWVPSSTTWANQPGVDTTGQVLIPHTDSATLDLNVNVTGMVNKMISSGNYGFKIQLLNEAIYNIRNFSSSAAADSSKRPMLIVTY